MLRCKVADWGNFGFTARTQTVTEKGVPQGSSLAISFDSPPLPATIILKHRAINQYVPGLGLCNFGQMARCSPASLQASFFL